jgi:hypothetical protein
MCVNGVLWGIHTLLLNHGVRGLQGIYFFVSTQIANAGCMCSVIVYFLHCICVCDCDSRYESLIMLSHSVMVRRSHLLARCYLGTMCMCTTGVFGSQWQTLGTGDGHQGLEKCQLRMFTYGIGDVLRLNGRGNVNKDDSTMPDKIMSIDLRAMRWM